MNKEKPSSIRIIGVIIIVFSSFAIFSNLGGFVAWSLINGPSGINESKNFIDLVLENFNIICLIMVILGVAFLLSGINLLKYRLWACKLLNIISPLMLVAIWSFIICLIFVLRGVPDFVIACVGFSLIGLLFSAPFIFLIWFLNRKKIKEHFI